jgi:hypothetical protein
MFSCGEEQDPGESFPTLVPERASSVSPSWPRCADRRRDREVRRCGPAARPMHRARWPSSRVSAGSPLGRLPELLGQPEPAHRPPLLRRLGSNWHCGCRPQSPDHRPPRVDPDPHSLGRCQTALDRCRTVPDRHRSRFGRSSIGAGRRLAAHPFGIVSNSVPASVSSSLGLVMTARHLDLGPRAGIRRAPARGRGFEAVCWIFPLGDGALSRTGAPGAFLLPRQ